jgi:two-component system, cell cycle sensor histidine kinase and response regulator CckA
MMSRHRSVAGLLRPRVFRSLRLLGLIALSAGALDAQTPAPPAAAQSDGLLMTSIRQYWELPAARKALPIDFELACTVTFFDPEWRVLFVQDEEGNGAYVPYGSNPYPFKAGEAILARGQILPPTVDISFEHAVVTARVGKPLRPIPVTHEVTQHTRFVCKYVSVEGLVDWVRRVDERHMQLAISIDEYNARCWVQMDPGAPTPDLLDKKVQVEGVYNAKVGPDGILSSLELMVPVGAKLSVLNRLEEHPGFNLPVTPIGHLLGRPADQLVRVVGSVVARETGRFVRIRDGSGQIDVMTGQMRPLAVNDMIEAVGNPVPSGPSWRLENAVFRSYTKTAASVTAPSEGTLGTAADVLGLSAQEAAAGRPVRLTGVVTWSHPSAPFFFITDSSGGIRIMRGDSDSMLRSPGRNVEVEGVTAMGAFAPVVVAKHFERVSESVLPMADQVSVEHALTGVEEAQWVEMRGYLRRIHRQGGWNRLELATATSDFVAILPATEDVSAMVGSVIQLHGVCAAEADDQRKLTGIQLWVPGISYVQVEEPAPVDPFTVPLRPLASLGQFETVHSFNRRVRVAGVVLHHTPGNNLWIEEDGHNLMIAASDALPLHSGDRVEAVGFLGRQAGRIALREAVVRRMSTGEQPRPQGMEPHSPPAVALDGKLVAISGLLLDSAQIGGTTQFTIQAGTVIFRAVLASAGSELAALDHGTQVRLTGVHEVEYDQNGRPAAFMLRLRSPSDVVVLEKPSWWTRGRILTFTGMLALGAFLFLGWNTVLRRQVRRQTGQIRLQLERETRLQAELARAGKLESLGLLAGGIAHDFNNLLTVLMGNISLIRDDSGLTPDAAESLEQAEKAASRARDLTQQLLTFAKGGAPIRSAVSLPEIVREVAEFALRGSKVRCQFDLPSSLWPANVDKGQIGQVVQNIVINAIQAMPEGGVVDIALSNREVGTELGGVLAPGRYVRLDIADHGPGISTADLGRIFDPYFTTKKNGSGLGLATVHSIVKKHAGHITAESMIGRGTTFHIWLPAAEAAATARTDPTPSAMRTGSSVGQARVLVMDDEEFIRTLAGSILRRYGHRPTTVGDGSAAVQEFVRARAAGEPYDLVILDLTIPGGMGGRQAMEELQRIDPDVRAIVSSGYSNDLVLANYQAHGFRGMISKPYDVADFAHAVETVLKGERA